MAHRKYTKIDENNLAVIEMQEIRNILNKDQLIAQKKELVDKLAKDIKDIDEALAEFTTTTK